MPSAVALSSCLVERSVMAPGMTLMEGHVVLGLSRMFDTGLIIAPNQ